MNKEQVLTKTFQKSNLRIINLFTQFVANRLSSTIGGIREMDQLYTTSQVSNKKIN